MDQDSAGTYYANCYESVNYGGVVGLVSKLTHLSLEKFPFTKNSLSKNLKILELGAGQGQHHKYVSDNYYSYLMTDMRPNLLKGLVFLDSRSRVEELPIDAENLPYRDNEFDRIIATCLLIHLQNHENALQEWKRVVRSGGVISIYVPCESGVLLRLAQSLSTRRRQRKLGLDAKYLHYQEHRYSYPFLISIIRNVFGKNFVLRKFPFLIGNFDTNLWSIVTVTNIKE